MATTTTAIGPIPSIRFAGRADTIDELSGSAEGARLSADTDTAVENWRLLCADLPSDQSLAERLDLLGLSDDDLRQALMRLEHAYDANDTRDWAADLRQWWERGSAPRERRVQHSGDAGLLGGFQPIVQGVIDELTDHLRDLMESTPDLGSVAPNPESLTVALSSGSPFDVIGPMALRTCVLELNVARVEGRLTAETPEARFNEFAEMLTDRQEMHKFLAEYTALARLLSEQLRFWIDTRVEIVERLVADLPALTGVVLPAEHGMLTGSRIGAGDGHRGGRSVAILEFENARLVYKPRSLAVDRAFDDVLGWANQSHADFDFRRVAVVDRGTHGWVEYVDSDSETDASGADRYAYRLGALAAILHGFHATDFHLENVIAEGEHPVLVDLESVIHVDLDESSQDDEVSPAHLALRESVFATGLLPARMIVKDDDGTHTWDFSGVSGGGGVTPFAVGTFDNVATDTMQFVPRRMELGQERNQPHNSNETFSLLGRVEHFARGFTDGYRLISDNGDELLGQSGPVAAFAETEMRHIARATNVYVRLLQDATHPDFLRTGPDRDRVLSRICRGLATVPFREAMFRSEISEMRRGDIPVFSVHLGSGEIRGGDSDQVLGRVAETPIDRVSRRLRSLDQTGLDLQLQIIRASFAAAQLNSAPTHSNGRQRSTAGNIDNELLIEESRRCARRLLDTSVRSANERGWIGLNLVSDEHWTLEPSGLDMYSGLPGILLGLDAAGRVSGDPLIEEAVLELTDQLQKLTADACDALDNDDSGPLDIGLMGPISGPMYALSVVSAMRGKAEPAESAHDLIRLVARSYGDDDMNDVVGGSAGAIFGLLALSEVLPSDAGRGLAEQLGHRLSQTAVAHGDGRGWAGLLGDSPLAGWSHGASGIAVALARLAQHVPSAQLAELVRDALEFERGLFDSTSQNWRDLRDLNPSQDAGMVAWCHGAPGIAAARRELQRIGFEEDAVDLERSRAVRTSAETGFLLGDTHRGIGNHSLCHGDLGNLLILDQTVDPTTEPDIAQSLPGAWTALIQDGRENGWLCGVPTGLEVPGLMCGLSGIAWGLARKADPDAVPDLLTGAAPSTRRS